MGQPEADQARRLAMSVLGNGLYLAKHYEDALPVREAELSTLRRLGDSEHNILVTQNNLASTYAELGHIEKALSMEQDVYSGRLKLHGEDHPQTIIAANNYAFSLIELDRFEEAKTLLRKTIPVALRVLGDSRESTLRTQMYYAVALYGDPGATLNDLHEAVTTLEDAERIGRRVLGGAHPLWSSIMAGLRAARAALHARETPPTDAREAGDLDEVEDA